MGSLIGIAHFTLHEGKAAEFKRLSRECMDIVREKDSGTLRYEIFMNADESGAVVVEEYVDTRALMEHSANIGADLGARVIATGDVRGELLGDIDAEFLASMAGGPVTPFAPYLSLR